MWSAAESIVRGRLGVDVIALLAVAGAVAVGELLAAAVISVMLTSGRFLEAWAAQRARHDLNALLARAPRTARRYRGGSLETVPLEQVAAGDVLLVAPGDVLPVDGTVGGGGAVLDESALTGEARPAEHGPRAAVRSGTLNAGGPFDLRATTSAADSTYAGIVRLDRGEPRQQAHDQPGDHQQGRGRTRSRPANAATTVPSTTRNKIAWTPCTPLTSLVILHMNAGQFSRRTHQQPMPAPCGCRPARTGMSARWSQEMSDLRDPLPKDRWRASGSS